MDIEKRKELAKYLRRGDIKKLAASANVTRQTVERWIKGVTIESTIEPYIVEFVEKRKLEVKERLSASMNN